MDPFSLESVPGVTTSGSEEESSSAGASAASATPNPQGGVAQRARLQLGLPEASNPAQVGAHAGVPDSEEEVDVEAFRVEADSLKARYEVCHQTV